MFKNLRIGRKLGIGFGAVLLLFAVAGFFSLMSFIDVKSRLADIESAEGNRAFMIEKEVDHLKWVNQLNQLFLDDEVTRVEVQMDDHKCGLGQWLYGEETVRLAESDRELGRLLEALKKPHSHLHESAKHIDELYRHDDPAAVKAAMTVLENETGKALSETQEILGHVKAHFGNLAESAGTATRNDVEATSSLLMVLVFGGFLIGVGGAWYIGRNITRPMIQMAAAAEGISRGDIQQDVAFESLDETGQLACSLDV